MGLFHCVFMLMRIMLMIPLDLCLREMNFSQSLAFFNVFHLSSLNSHSRSLVAASGMKKCLQAGAASRSSLRQEVT